MKVLITGGAGFIGQYLARALSGKHELVALDSLSAQVHSDPAASTSRFPGQVVRGEINDLGVWAKVPRADVVVHLAAETGTGQSMYEQDRYREVNVEGTRIVADQAVAWGAPLIVMSSRAVYGNGRFECPAHGTSYGKPCCKFGLPAPSRESDEHKPVSVYGETKSQAEAVVIEHAQKIPVDIVRPQNVVGFGQALHNPYTGVLAAFLARLREGRALSVYGDGSATRDFEHVSDVAALLEWLVRNPNPASTPRVLNAGTGERTTLTQLANYARQAAPVGSPEIQYVEVHRAGDIDHAVADLTFVKSLGAPQARVSTQEAIADFIRKSWELPGAASSAWDSALDELSERGLTS